MKLIDKSALVAEIKGYISNYKEIVAKTNRNDSTWVDSVSMIDAKIDVLQNLLFFLDTLEVKEVDEQKERMNDCPFRQVGCTMYEGHVLECKGACSWVVGYPKLKQLKVQKGE